MKNLSQGNKGIKALAKENPALVENRFGYDVPSFFRGGNISIPRIGNIDRLIERNLANLSDDPNFNYARDVLGINIAEEDQIALSPEEIEAKLAASRLARGYGSSGGMGTGRSNYTSTTPGAPISIDARDETPDAYRFYPSEVSKLYSQMKGVPFSPLVAPPKEATYIDSMQPRKIKSQLYAKDGTYVNAKDGFPEREELVTGPGGEKGDKIPAMLSDGEFIFNSAAVRGMGIMAGASPDDEYEQRLMGARKMYEFQKEAEEMAKRYK
tara:strand:- start:152 stop:955 length:804 start_codon:yes stop_codon:yes gene_type:complete